MPGPVPKPDDRRQRRNQPAVVQIVHGPKRQVPDPPTDLLDVTIESWNAYWTSSVADAVDIATDMPAIERLFTLRDERERALRAYKKGRLVKGSQGQPVINPLAKQMSRLDGEIRQLEDRLGLTPKARAQLGITIGAAKRTLDDLNRSLEWDDDADPRLEVADEA